MNARRSPSTADAALAEVLRALAGARRLPLLHVVGNHELLNFPRIALAPRLPLSRHSQRGQVVLGAGRHVVPARALELVDAAGAVHALTPGISVAVKLQRVTIRATQA